MIKEILDELLSYDDKAWDRYVFGKEPLIGRLSQEERDYYAELAHKTGITLAREVRAGFPDNTVQEIIKKSGIRLDIQEKQDNGSYIMFACYTEPNSILLYNKPIRDAEVLLKRENCDKILEEKEIREILLAHELFHWYEYKRKDLPTQQKYITTFKIGKFANRSKIVTLSEIGAMAFAKELLQLKYSPYILDVILLMPFNRALAKEVFDSMRQKQGLGPGDDSLWEWV